MPSKDQIRSPQGKQALLNQEETGRLLLQGDGIRSWFHITAGDGYMTTLWEREVDGNWLRWMDMRFDRM